MEHRRAAAVASDTADESRSMQTTACRPTATAAVQSSLYIVHSVQVRHDAAQLLPGVSKKVAPPLKLFGIFSLRLSLFA